MIKAVGFYLLYPILYGVAKLPYSTLYKLSDILYFILKKSGYRQKIIEANLRKSFPQKTHAELLHIQYQYNTYLCDLVLETLKTLVITESEINERCTIQRTPWLEQLAKDKKSIIILMGHYGNWEWAGLSFSLSKLFLPNIIYKPLSNPYFDQMLAKCRTRFGARITKMNDTLREMAAAKNQSMGFALVADQTPFPDHAYWMHFLNQETAVYTGFEKLARRFNYPVVYAKVVRTRRGYYQIFPELLFENPKETAENEICATFMHKLEQDITADPAIWLWSHRRWKHKRNTQTIKPQNSSRNDM